MHGSKRSGKFNFKPIPGGLEVVERYMVIASQNGN